MRTDVIFNTDAASGLGRLPDNSIDCIVTSPPYWQLRDYGLSPILFGGQQDCEHDFDDYAICRSCGGWLGQLGQEPSREMFLEHLVGIFDECRRVLKNTGTLWVNLGDSYSKLNKYNRPDDWPPGKNAHCLKTLRVDLSMHRVPHKSLCNIPGLFAEMMILRGVDTAQRDNMVQALGCAYPCQRPFYGGFREGVFLRQIPEIRLPATVRTLCRE